MIEIKLTDLPEFDRQLKITITLEKDEEGIRESVTTSPELPSSPSSPIDTPTTIKKRTATKKTQPLETGDGIKGDKVEQSSSPPTKRSGNMMNLEI